MVRDLKEAGIRDVWRFTGGERKNAISLGLFSRRVNAEKVKQEAEARGFQPEVHVRYRDVQQYHLEFSNTEELPDGLQRMLESEYSGLELSVYACD